jgi:hypothetical protein
VRLDWQNVIIPRAREIVDEYDSEITLRQAFYRLVAEGAIPNNLSSYSNLSHLTARLRREGTFPALVDMGREIHLPPSWDSPEAAKAALRRQYRRDRTAGQDRPILLGCEKNTLVALLSEWYGHTGIPIVPLRGYSSESYESEILAYCTDWLTRHDGDNPIRRPMGGPLPRMLYVGDIDPSGEDIERNLGEQLPALIIERVAVTIEQVDTYDLPKQPGKPKDRRAPAFIEKYGELFQVEVEALRPEDLHDLINDALDAVWNLEAYDAVIRQEELDRARL